MVDSNHNSGMGQGAHKPTVGYDYMHNRTILHMYSTAQCKSDMVNLS